MPPHATLVHRTEYRYDRPVQLGPQWVRLRPRPDPARPGAPYTLHVHPTPASLHWQLDLAGNRVARLILPGPLDLLTLEVRLELDLAPVNPFDFLIAPEAATWPFTYDPETADLLRDERRPDHPGPALAALQAETASPGATVDVVLSWAASVRDRLAYIVRAEPGVWPPDYSLAEARGSCRDSAWLLVQLMRLHGVAARFVSGYLLQGPEGAPRDSAELHAWAEAYLPGAGWVGVDATSGFLTAEAHIPLAASAGIEGAAPLSGTVEPAQVRLETSIIVTPQ